MPFHSPRLKRAAGQDRRLAMRRGPLWPRQALSAMCLAAAALLASGCTTPNWRGDGYGDETSRWGERLRSPTKNVEGYGYSTRAQEIEHNLGVR